MWQIFFVDVVAVLPRLDNPPLFLATSETWIKIHWLRWNGILESPLSLMYQVEYQPSYSSEGSDWLIGPLVPHEVPSNAFSTEYLEAKITDLVRNTFYDFRVRPLLLDADGHWTNGSASPLSSAYRTRCSGSCMLLLLVPGMGRGGEGGRGTSSWCHVNE